MAQLHYRPHAIIVAAGRGSRLNDLTRACPKCLLEVNGKTLLQHQLDGYAEQGIREITIVRGYLAERIQVDGARYCYNAEYATTNTLVSLLTAAHEMSDAFIISYSDIIFEAQVISKLCDSEEDIAIVVDTRWLARYSNRDQHPVEEAEKVVFDADGRVVAIGKTIDANLESTAEFVGMVKCTARGAGMFKSSLLKARKRFHGPVFVNGRTFEQAYLSDFIQHLVHTGIAVRVVPIRQGWFEIDTPQDLDVAREHFKKDCTFEQLATP